MPFHSGGELRRRGGDGGHDRCHIVGVEGDSDGLASIVGYMVHNIGASPVSYTHLENCLSTGQAWNR